jgi:hypothetical protein
MFVNPRRQGDLGEASALQWLTSRGFAVAIPFGHSPDWDLVIERTGQFMSVQVKTSNFFVKSRWSVAVCTRGGNQSWNRIVKHFDAQRCDYLFVHVGDGRRWFIPSHAVEAKTSIKLGGVKYSEFEVDRGEPLVARPVRNEAA